MKKSLTLIFAIALSFGALAQTTNFTVTNTAEWNNALEQIRNGGNSQNYIITITGSVPVSGTTANSFGNVQNIEVTLKGSGTLSLSSDGSILRVDNSQTLIIDGENLTLQGRDGNNNAIVNVGNNGTLQLNSGAIRDNNIDNSRFLGPSTSGIRISGGTFIMYGGEISGNINRAQGWSENIGGVSVDGGTFIMYGGQISRNVIGVGGTGNFATRSTSGVFILNGGVFTMNGGKINENQGNSGVRVENDGVFTMNGGEIMENTFGSGSGRQGGVAINGGTFTINNGNISNNSLNGVLILDGKITINGGKINENGGSGVRVENDGIFTMNDGLIGVNANMGVILTGGGAMSMYGGQISGNISNHSGGGVLVDGGTFIMYGGQINGNISTYQGGGVLVHGTFIMYGGQINGNITNLGGGGVFVSHGTFIMFDGKISGNTAQYGGGVMVSEIIVFGLVGKFTMYGGLISNNTATVLGGGVAALLPMGNDYADGEITLGGTAVINNNTVNNNQNNVFLDNNRHVTLSTANLPTMGMSVGITKTFNEGVFVESGATADHVQFFFADEPNMCVFHNSPQGELQLKAGVEAENPIITLQPQGATYLHNVTATTLSVSAEVSDDGTLTYQWYRNTTNSITGGIPISGATGANYTPSTSTAGTMYYWVVVTNTIPDNLDGCHKTRSITSNIVAITVSINISVSANPTIAGTVSGGGTNIANGTSVTVEADPNLGYNFVNWTENSTLVSANASYTFYATSSRILVANFIPIVYNITYVLGIGGTNHPDNPTTFTIETPTITLQNPTRTGYFFSGWVEGNTIPQGSTGDKTFTAQWSDVINALPPIITVHPQSATYSHNAVPNVLTVVATSPDGGTLSYQWYSNTTNSTIGGTPINGATTANFTPSTATVGTMFYFVVVTNTIADNGDGGTKTATATSFVAEIIVEPLPEPEFFNITVSANPPIAGSVAGGGTNITHGTSVTVSATANECWTFANWTSNGVVVSNTKSFTFSATETAHLVANFDGPILDFDTYASTLWNNTFMLNLNRLRADGFEALDARWFRNGIEITNTRTNSPFSYSAGPNASDLLQLAPTFYHFEIFTERCGVVPSTPKTITSHNPFVVETHGRASLHAFPNPIQSGKTIILENTRKGHQIQIFNRSGMLVKSAVATDGTTQFTLNIPQGIYIIHVENQTVQILVTE